MKLSWPLVSSTAQRTSSSEAMPCWRAAAASSSSVIRLRRRLRSIGLPSSTTITGSPSSSGRSPGNRKLVYDTATVSSATVPPTSIIAGDREVVLRDALLDEVADHDEQDQVERLAASDSSRRPDHARQEEDEDEPDDGADDEVHLRVDRDRAVDVQQRRSPS